ncbi:MAG: HypC/HybG/HupF family hydrogenase formation chaperone [Magnetovibrio sp.]|nr:HypC/HybG/HupF family hydrogenase formation chaperone [Magnetovibrio sp.]
MCLGIPMKIEQLGHGWAQCVDRDGSTRRVTTLLIDSHDVGDWVLVHLDNALRLMDEAEANQIADGLKAVQAALRGEDVDHLFADLVEREPQLPQNQGTVRDTTKDKTI